MLLLQKNNNNQNTRSRYGMRLFRIELELSIWKLTKHLYKKLPRSVIHLQYKCKNFVSGIYCQTEHRNKPNKYAYSTTKLEWFTRRNPAHCWKDFSPNPLINLSWFLLVKGPLFSRLSTTLLAFVRFNPATLLQQTLIVKSVTALAKTLRFLLRHWILS